MKRSDIPFAANDAHRFLPWVIGIMASIAALLLCLGITLSAWIVDRHDSYTGNFTVNIPADSELPAGKLDFLRAELQKTPGVSNVKTTDESELRDLLKPWIGGGDSVAALPLPVVMDVKVSNGANVNYSELQKKLAAIIPGTEVDSHERWIASFSDFSAALRWLMTALASVIVGGLALMIAFTSRASLKLHTRSVQLLHSIGAEDSYIARQFQREAFLLMLRGTIPGCIAGGVTYWATGAYLSSLQAASLPALPVTASHGALLVFMPLACGIVAWMTARYCVLRQLRQVL